MFFNWMNLDTKLRVAILGQDFAFCCDTFRFVTPKRKSLAFHVGFYTNIMFLMGQFAFHMTLGVINNFSFEKVSK